MTYSYIPRLISNRVKKLFESSPSLVLTGARQVGKSTLVKHLFPSRDMIVFDPVIDVGNARMDPDLFLDNHPGPVILDEIQYAPELVSAISNAFCDFSMV
jgi:predicted AAA+ superfamily ATPase